MSEPVKALQAIKAYVETVQKEEIKLDVIAKACDTALDVEYDDLPVALEQHVGQVNPDNTLCSMLHEDLQPHQTCPVCMLSGKEREATAT